MKISDLIAAWGHYLNKKRPHKGCVAWTSTSSAYSRVYLVERQEVPRVFFDRDTVPYWKVRYLDDDDASVLYPGTTLIAEELITWVE